MRQRLGIAGVAAPQPTAPACSTSPQTGLDPAGMRDMKALDPRPVGAGHHRAPLEPPDGRGGGAVQPRGDHQPRPHPLRGRRRRPDQVARAPGTACARPTSPPPSTRRTSSGSRDVARRRTASCGSAPTRSSLERFMITLGKRRIGVRALIPQQATLEQLFFQLTEQDGDAPVAGARPGRRGGGVMPTFLTAYRWELRKLVSQKRTYLGLGPRRRCRSSSSRRSRCRAGRPTTSPSAATCASRASPSRSSCCSSRRCGSSRS